MWELSNRKYNGLREVLNTATRTFAPRFVRNVRKVVFGRSDLSDVGDVGRQKKTSSDALLLLGRGHVVSQSDGKRGSLQRPVNGEHDRMLTLFQGLRPQRCRWKRFAIDPSFRDLARQIQISVGIGEHFDAETNE